MKLHSFISLLAVAQAASAISLNVDDKQSIKEAAATAAKKLAALYPRNETWFIPGDFGVIQTADGRNDKGYYWWEGGAAMGVRVASLPESSATPLINITRHGSITGR